MSRYLISLDLVNADDGPKVGAKAAALGALLGAGFPVPPGFCVTTTAFRQAIEPWWDQIDALIHQHDLQDPAGAAAAAASIGKPLADLTVPASLVLALDTIVGPDHSPLAVRSSATAEDSAEVSSAGQYRSVIGVHGQDALQTAIVDVWRSFFGANALNARAAAGRLNGEEGMAVLILPLIDAESAGVAFSVDPVQGRGERVMVTAAWGLGAGVVDGSVAADTYWVRRDGATEGFEIEERRIVEQVEQITLDSAGGLQRLSVPADRRRAACLPESWLLRIAQFCVAAEGLFACPQDMEWAISGRRVWVLQSRPITGLPPELTQTSSFPVTWRDEDERHLPWIHYPYWRHVLRPLEQDYATDRQAAQAETARLTGSERTMRFKLTNGRLYTCWAPSDLPAGDRRIRRGAMDDLLVRLHSQSVTTWDHWGPEIVKATERLDAFQVRGASGPQLAEHLEDARGAYRRHMALHNFVWRSHDQPLYDAYTALSGLAGPAAREAANRLAEGEETATTRLIDGLYALARDARQVPAVAALVADPPPDLLDRLAAMPEGAAFRAQVQGFLASFGNRTGLGYGSDGTICVPSWRENPALALHFVAPYLDPAVEAPAAGRARAQAERDATIEDLCARCDDTGTVAWFRREFALARRQAMVAEEHNHYIEQMMNGQLRHALLAAARWLLERGALATMDEVFWLHYDEILSALREEAPRSFAGAISGRQAQAAAWEKLARPPLLGLPDARLPERPPWQDQVTPVARPGDDLVTGLGASPGRHRGRARIVPTSVLLPDVSPGDILVAENAGPRWTPLIPILGALVLDGGSVGQHHAITAREYGVPAVIGAGNATRRVPDGAWLTVDGTAGTVEIEALS